MPCTIAAMSLGKVVAPLLGKVELAIQGWHLLFIATIAFTAFGFGLFLCFYRAPDEEQTPLLDVSRRPVTDNSNGKV